MKKILLISGIFAALVSATSCNMDLRPAGVIDPNESLETKEDADKLRDGMYHLLRSTVGGGYASIDEIRSDLFHATSSFGNNGGTMYNWIQTATDGDASSLWANSYYVIADANFFLQRANAVNTSEWTEQDRASLDVYKGEAYFIRAYHHMELAELFCLDYVGNEQSYGIPYVTRYAPTSDQTQYPSRGTLEHTFEMILADLDSAAKYITTPGQRGSDRITKDAVTALQARVALQMGDYDTAADKANELIESGTYPLVSSETSFNAMWTSDATDESILMLYASRTELGASNDYGYIGYSANKDQYSPYYVPEQWVIDLYEPEDWRFKNQFLQTDILAGGGQTFNLYIFYKFIGNSALRVGSGYNYQIRPKVFRIAEMYLIRAEAVARGGVLSSGTSNPLSDLNLLRNARGATALSGTGDEQILSLILEERVRELIGEGFRIQDLKRFRVNLQRNTAQVPEAIYMPASNQETFEKSYTDDRMLYPIPQTELDANPNMAAQQNSGY